MSRFSKFQQECSTCGALTTKKYAREHDGNCKTCFTGVAPDGPKCPDCGGPIEAWKLKKHYHCSNCTREADPEGYANEVRGMYDQPSY